MIAIGDDQRPIDRRRQPARHHAQGTVALAIVFENIAQTANRCQRIALRGVVDQLDLRGFTLAPGVGIVGGNAQHEIGILLAHGFFRIGGRVLDFDIRLLEGSDQVRRIGGTDDGNRQRLLGLAHLARDHDIDQQHKHQRRHQRAGDERVDQGAAIAQVFANFL